MLNFQNQRIGIENAHLSIAIEKRKISNSKIAHHIVQSIAHEPNAIAKSAAAVAPLVTQFINAAIADNTRRAYQQDLRDFSSGAEQSLANPNCWRPTSQRVQRLTRPIRSSDG